MKNIGLFGLVAVFIISSSAMAQVDGKKKGQRGAGGAPNIDRILQALDKDNDGKLSKTEAPERMKERFDQMDANSDGFVDQEELKKAFARRMQRGNNPGPGRQFGNKGKGDAKKGNGTDQPRPAAGFAGRGLDLARMFKEGDQDGDGNLSPAEQKVIIERFNEMMSRVRQMRGNGNAKKKGGDRFARPDTDPVKPKRPGK